jgi:hypothetical protein
MRRSGIPRETLGIGNILRDLPLIEMFRKKIE